MKIIIVCRFNQARSIAIAAMLRQLFPQLQIATCGIEGEDNKLITADLCESWGLKEYDRVSRSLSFLEQANSEDFILAADDWVFDQVRRNFPHLSTMNLVTFADDHRLVPSDPTGMDPTDFSNEIAKACLLSMRWMNQILALPIPNIHAHIFNSQEGFNQFKQDPSRYAPGVQTFIDTEFAYPDLHSWNGSAIKAIAFHPRQLQVLTSSRSSEPEPRVFVSRFELDFPARFLLSIQWREFLYGISDAGPVALICKNFLAGPRSVISALQAINSVSTTFHV
jgi:protein-tyrosine-phosphatase